MNLKRKNIDLPVDVLQKLSLMAVARGKSLKAFIESELILKANSISIEVKENPSPSGDSWFNVPENMSDVEEGMSQYEEGRTKVYSVDELRNILGI